MLFNLVVEAQVLPAFYYFCKSVLRLCASTCTQLSAQDEKLIYSFASVVLFPAALFSSNSKTKHNDDNRLR